MTQNNKHERAELYLRLEKALFQLTNAQVESVKDFALTLNAQQIQPPHEDSQQ
jgi:hypothetical protein